LDELASGETHIKNGAVLVTVLPDNCWRVDAVTSKASLYFTVGEVNAFVRGVRDGEFDLNAVLAK
jgi:hypothetical protein